MRDEIKDKRQEIRGKREEEYTPIPFLFLSISQA
jgi:hypothetical protein